MRKQTRFDTLSAADLARETRALGLEKPNVLDIGQWRMWLAEQAAKAGPARVIQGTEEQTTVEPVEGEQIGGFLDTAAVQPKATTRKKGK